MNAKRMLALVLALMMVLALTACGNTGGNEKAEAEKEAEIEAAETGTAASCEALVAAVEKVYNDGDATAADAMNAAYGAEFGALMMDFVTAAQELDEVEEEDLSDVDILDLDGYRKGDAVKLTIAESTALDEDGLNEVRDQAASVSESMKMISGFVAVYDEMGEQELADAGMTADDVAQMKDYVAKLSKIGTFFEEAEIDEGCKLKLKVKVGDDAQELEKTAIRLNGNWVFADLIELMA